MSRYDDTGAENLLKRGIESLGHFRIPDLSHLKSSGAILKMRWFGERFAARGDPARNPIDHLHLADHWFAEELVALSRVAQQRVRLLRALELNRFLKTRRKFLSNPPNAQYLGACNVHHKGRRGSFCK